MNSDPLILIIDDIPENIQVLLNILQQKNYRFAISTNAQDAYKAIEAEKPDLILLDIILPQINGFEICKKLKSDNSTKDIPIIFLTVLDEIEDILRGFQMGAVDYITKPYNEQVVLARVKNIIQIEEVKKQLNKQNEDKDKFISILAHDLKNPFTNILSFTRLLMDNKVANDGNEGKVFEALFTDALRGNHLLENLLIWTKSSANIITKPNKIRCGLKEMVDNTFMIFETNSLQQNTKLINEISDNDFVYADPNMVETILRNLLSNAIKYTSEGKVIFKSEQIDENVLKVSVVDNGEGVPESVKSKIFEAGTSFHSNSSPLNGTGLGLSICKEFIELNDGEIGFESNNENGTTFYFTLPISS